MKNIAGEAKFYGLIRGKTEQDSKKILWADRLVKKLATACQETRSISLRHGFKQFQLARTRGGESV